MVWSWDCNFTDVGGVVVFEATLAAIKLLGYMLMLANMAPEAPPRQAPVVIEESALVEADELKTALVHSPEKTALIQEVLSEQENIVFLSPEEARLSEWAENTTIEQLKQFLTDKEAKRVRSIRNAAIAEARAAKAWDAENAKENTAYRRLFR